jgi:hypothetical protein
MQKKETQATRMDCVLRAKGEEMRIALADHRLELAQFQLLEIGSR